MSLGLSRCNSEVVWFATALSIHKSVHVNFTYLMGLDVNTNFLSTLGSNGSNVLAVALDDGTVNDQSGSAAVLELLANKLLDQVLLGGYREAKRFQRSSSLGG